MESRATASADCVFCRDKSSADFKQPEQLLPYLNSAGKLLGRQSTGLCPLHQQELSRAVKRAREIGLAPK